MGSGLLLTALKPGKGPKKVGLKGSVHSMWAELLGLPAPAEGLGQRWNRLLCDDNDRVMLGRANLPAWCWFAARWTC